METYLLVISLIVLLFFSGYFSSSEVALFSLSPMQIKAYQSSKDEKKRLIANLLHSSRDLLVTVFIMNTLVNILVQNVASQLFEGFAGWELKVGLPLILVLIFGEIIPKNYGLQNNTSLSYKVAPFIYWIQKGIEPIRKFVIAVTQPVSKLLFFYLKKAESISKEELAHTLLTSKKYGVLTDEEAELAWGYLNLQEKSVKEVMRPKQDILYYCMDEPLTKLVYLFMEQECSKIPVCTESLDNVLGIITARGYLKNRNKINEPKDVTQFLDPPFYIPETVSARNLLKKFDQIARQFALVVDEYGQVSGIITYEDLAEVVVGEIVDMRDTRKKYTRSGKNEIIAGGRLEIDEFYEIFQQELENPTNMVTIGGWLIDRLGKIPKTGTEFETEQFFFQILSSDPNRIRRVYIRKKQL